MNNLRIVAKRLAYDFTQGISYYAANGQEPYNDGHDLFKPYSVLSYLTVDSDSTEEIDADVQVKDCANADGTEESNKESLTSLCNVMDVQMHGKDLGYPAEQ